MKSFNKEKGLVKILYASPFIITLGVYAGLMIKTLDNDVLFDKKYSKLKKEVAIENQTDIIVVNSIDDEVSKILEETDQVETSETEEIIEEEIVEPEKYSTELLDSGFEFEEIDFDSLKEINNDSCAWLSMKNIDYPVVQGEDNDYYLHHNIYKQKSGGGTLFLDSNINSFEDDELSDYTVIYGHKMKNGSMFSSLHNYRNQEYYDNNQFGVVYTPDGYAYKADFFAGIVVDANNPISIDTTLNEEEIFNELISELKSNSTFKSDVSVEHGDKIIVLVTCSYETNNSRYCLYGKLTKQYTNYNQIEKKEKFYRK